MPKIRPGFPHPQSAGPRQCGLAFALALAAVGLAPAAAPAQGGPAPRRIGFAQSAAELAERLRAVPPGGSLRLLGVPLSGGEATLMLERFEVFTPDARVVLHGDGERTVPPPRRAYFRGEVAGDPASVAFLSVGEDGTARGLVSRQGRLHLIGQEGPDAAAPLITREIDAAALAKSQPAGWTCGGAPAPAAATGGAGEDLHQLFAPAARATAAATFTSFYSAEIAVETDYELYALFNNVNAAAGYVGDLLGAASAIYYRDVGTTLKVNYLALYTSPADPWTAADSLPALCEFGTYWHNNRPQAQYPRDTAVFLSGKPVNAGVAWLGVLCAADFAALPPNCTAGQWGGGYAAVLGIDGVFSLTNPSFFWDIYGTAHELGHNFNSPHTHCYNNVPTPAAAPPVDQCVSAGIGGDAEGETYNGGLCYNGPVSVPAGGGSMMSYCQFRPGGLANINLSFGQAGLYGTQSERVPGRMRDFVVSRACLAFIPARAADFNGDGRADVVIYRNGQWLFFALWPGS